MSSEATHTDHHLFRLIAGGDQAAFAELFRRYDRRIYPFVLKMIRSTALAEEITHEIFIKIWKNRDKLDQIDQPGSYILTIAARHTLDHIRRRLNETRMLQRLSASSSKEGHNDTEEKMMLRDRTALLQQAVDLLPPQQKLVYRLSRHEGLNYDEIGGQLNISPNTVRNHLVKALHFIRSYMRDQDLLPAALLAWATLLLKK